MKLQALFGSYLFDNKGTRLSTDILDDHVVLLYFSASWCRPCAAFTPQLIALRENVRAQLVPFEVVFISSDRNAAQFAEYFKKMPWLAPAYDSDRNAKINDKFKVTSIPYAAVLFPNNTAMTRDVVAACQRDPTGKFIVDMWRAAVGATVSTAAPAAVIHRPPTAPSSPTRMEFLPAARAENTRAKQYLALYLTNEMEDDGFIEVVLAWYASVNAHGAPDFVEVVFVEVDVSPRPAFLERMPWVTLSTTDARALAAKFLPLVSLPALIAVDQRSGAIVCLDGAARLEVDGLHFPWKNSAWQVCESVQDKLGKSPAVLLFTDSIADDDLQRTIDAFAEAAEAADPSTSFVVCSLAQQCEYLRNKLALAPDVLVVHLDASTWAVFTGTVSARALLDFAAAHKPAPLPF